MGRLTIFNHWIFNKDKKPLYEKDGNILTGDINTLAKPDGQPAKLRKSPTGWRNVEIGYARNNKYLGLFRDFAISLFFVEDAAKIIKDTLWRVGFEAQLFYGLAKLDQYSFPPVYSPYYLGEIDLSKFRQTREGIEITVVEGGPIKLMKAFEATNYQIPVFADPEAVTVYLDGLPFNNKVEWTIYPQLIYQRNFDQHVDLGAGLILQEGSSQGILVSDVESRTASEYPGNQYLIKSINKFITLDITGVLQIGFATTDHIKIILERLNDDVVDEVIIYEGDHSTDDNITIDISETIDLIPGDSLGLRAVIDDEVIKTPFFFVKEVSTIRMEYEVTFDPTLCKALLPKRLAEKLVEKFTNGRYSLSSQFLDAMENVVYTSGMAIRNFTDEKSMIKISWNDFYKSLMRFAVMLGTRKDQIIIEGMATAFDPTIICDLGVVSNLVITQAADMTHNTISTGYRNQTYDNVNGLDEFNVTQQWTTPITKVVSELDLTSPVRADMYGIELTRLNLYGKDTTDSSSDNDTFFLSVIKGATIVYYNGPFEVTGTDTIKIPRDLASMTGQTITVEGLGTYIVVNTSYLVVGYTLLTVSGVIANGNYVGSIQYDDPDVYRLYRPAYSAITGVLHPTRAFNTELSPKRGLLNNARLIRSFVEDPAAIIKFQTGDKNSELSTTLAGVTITEKEDIVNHDLGDPFYLPYYFEFDTEMPINYKTIIETNPYGTIKFSDENGNVFYGYMWDGDVKPATNDRQKWKLLCSPLTDKTLLI